MTQREEDTQPLRLPAPGMPAWQKVLIIALTILAWLAVLAAAVWLIRHMPRTLAVILSAGVLALALGQRWRMRRSAWLAAVSAGLVLLIGLGTLALVGVASQAQRLGDALPGILQQAAGSLGMRAGAWLNGGVLIDLQVAVDGLAGRGLLSSPARLALDAVLTLVASLFLLTGVGRGARWLGGKASADEPIPGFARRAARSASAITQMGAAPYVRGSLVTGLLAGVLTGLGLWVLGVPYALLLGVLAFFLQMLPVTGGVIAAACVALLGLSRGLGIGLVALVYYLIVRFLGGSVVGPRLLERPIRTYPVVGILGLLVGVELFGMWGALLGPPLAGLAQAVLVGAWRARQAAGEASARRV